MLDSLEDHGHQDAGRGQDSFCIPRAALNALLDAKASAYEICAYLVLARFTDASGQFSTASISAVNRYTGANKVRGGPVDRAIHDLQTIRVKKAHKVANGMPGRAAAFLEEIEDLGPILLDRASWIDQVGGVLPDGPTERGKVQFVLPDFGEPLADRIWFGGNLVKGIGGFTQPLRELKNAGDVAARLLLLLHMAHDMEMWGGVRPVGLGCGPWVYFKSVGDVMRVQGSASFFRAKAQGAVLSQDMLSLLLKGQGASQVFIREALQALESAGFVYGMVVVLNRNAEKVTGANGNEYDAIPNDAEPLYELDCLSEHGFKPVGEEGVGAATAKTAGELGYPVALEGGRLDGTYAAFVPAGSPAMIVGIYRLRFRVANAKNAGVKGAWARIYQGNREAMELVQKVRSANGLSPLPAQPIRKPEDIGVAESDLSSRRACNVKF